MTCAYGTKRKVAQTPTMQPRQPSEVAKRQLGEVMIRRLLLPGEYHMTKEPMIIETLVGSCVSVCLFNMKTGWAAMNHFLQARPGSETDLQIGRYGSTATEHIIKASMRMDAEPTHYRAQVFGGAAVIKANESGSDIGRNNAGIAEEILKRWWIRIVRKEVGGVRGRRIRFETATNTVFCRFADEIGKKHAKI